MGQCLLCRIQCPLHRLALCLHKLQCSSGIGSIGGGLRCLIEQPCLIPLFGLCQIHRPHHAFLSAFTAQE